MIIAVSVVLIMCLLFAFTRGTTSRSEVTISFDTPFPRTSREYAQLREILDLFEAGNPYSRTDDREARLHIKVQLNSDAPREPDRILRRIMAGKAGDIIEMPVNDLSLLAGKAAVLPLGNCLGENAGEIFSSALIVGQYESNCYALPFRAKSIQLICNVAMLEEAGFNPANALVNTWDEFIVTCQRIAATRGEGRYPLAIDGAEGDSPARLAVMLIAQAGGTVVVKEALQDGEPERWRMGIGSEESVRGLEQLQKLSVSMPPCSNWSREDLLREFMAGRIAMIFSDAEALSCIRAGAPHLRVQAYEAPVDRAYGSSVEFYGTAVTAPVTHHPGRFQACLRLITWLCDLDAQRMILTGGSSELPAFAPVSRDLLNHAWYDRHPEYKPFLKALGYPVGYHSVAGWPEVQRQVFLPEVRKVLQGSRSGRESASVMQSKGNLVLSTFYGYIGHISETTVLGMSAMAVGIFFLVFFAVGHHPRR